MATLYQNVGKIKIFYFSLKALTSNKTISPEPIGTSVVKGFSVMNLNTSPRINVTTPASRKALISKVFGFRRTDINKVAPTREMRDIKAKTESKNENKYIEAEAETATPTKI